MTGHVFFLVGCFVEMQSHIHFAVLKIMYTCLNSLVTDNYSICLKIELFWPLVSPFHTVTSHFVQISVLMCEIAAVRTCILESYEARQPPL